MSRRTCAIVVTLVCLALVCWAIAETVALTVLGIGAWDVPFALRMTGLCAVSVVLSFVGDALSNQEEQP